MERGVYMNAEMDELLQLLESEVEWERRKAMNALLDWNVQLDIKDTYKLLEKAAQLRPVYDEDWDDPSYCLVSAACVFISDDMLPVIEKHILNYSVRAINKVLSLCVLLNSEPAKDLYNKIFQQYYTKIAFIPEYNDRAMIVDSKEAIIFAIEQLIENNAHTHEWYKPYYHYLLAAGIQSGYFTHSDFPLSKEYVASRLQGLFDKYLEVHSVYEEKLVYNVWKDSYFNLRFEIRIFLTLFNDITKDEEFLELKNILKWKDNVIRLIYIELLWKRGINLGEDTILEILYSHEGSVQAYNILDRYKPDLIPNDTSFHNPYLSEIAETTFYNHPEAVEKLPDEVEIMGSFEEVDPYFDEKLTYYVVRIRSEDPAFKGQGWMRLLIGAYYSHELPRFYQPQTLMITYTDLVPWDQKSLDEHIQDFREIVNSNNDSLKNDVSYQSAPVYSKKNNTIAFIIGFYSLILTGFFEWFAIGVLAAPIWLIFKYFHSKKLEKNILIQLKGFNFEYFYFDESTYVNLAYVSKISLEKMTVAKPERFLFLPIKKWHYVFYDMDGEILYAIPKQYFYEEDYFFIILKNIVKNLTHKPELEWEKQNAS